MGLIAGILGIIAGIGGFFLGQKVEKVPPAPTHFVASPTTQATTTNNVSPSTTQSPQQEASNVAKQVVNQSPQTRVEIKNEVNFGKRDAGVTINNNQTTLSTGDIEHRTQSQHYTVDQKANTHQQVHPEQTQLTHYLQPITQSLSQLPKWPVAIVGIAGAAVTAIYYVRKLEADVYAKGLWSTWKRNIISTTALETMKKEELTTLLIASIQKKYMTHKTFAKVNSPMKLFLHDWHNEVHTLKSYNMYATIIQKLHLGSVVGTHEHHVEYANEGLKRLDILKRAFDGLTGELRSKTA